MEESDWNGTLFYELGKYTGNMHRLTKSYCLSDPAYKRQEWDEEEQLKLRKYVPADQHLVFERADALMEKLRRLPKNPENYLCTPICTTAISIGTTIKSLHLILMIPATIGL